MPGSRSSSSTPDGAAPASGPPPLDQTSAYDYALPEALIAATPADARDESRLMVLREERPPAHRRFSDLPAELQAGDVLVRNTARVLAARLLGRKKSGGRVELLALEPVGGDWSAPGPSRFVALGRASKPLRPGQEIHLDGGATLHLVARHPDGRLELVNDSPEPLADWLETHGTMPLPPYLRRARDERGVAVPEALDAERYQTVYAARPGAVAAPTAGLHFTPEVFAALARAGVEVVDVHLEVGAGTFQPVEVERLDEHPMHAERYSLGEEAAERLARARAEGRRLVAVGTTAFRVLEDQAQRGPKPQAGTFETRLFVRPGSTLRWVDGLVTNFHLPRSTLLMLVATMAGYDRIVAAYAEAIARGYRFYSYGDAMLLLPSSDPGRRP
jgi:S-adenosylmethionine:tRNA ribosyltransferase-isomerase